MKQIGDYVVYQKDVCKIVDIKENIYSHLECYSLVPVIDQSLRLSIPVTNENIRDLMSKEEIEALIREMPSIPIIEQEDRQMEAEYKRLLMNGTAHDLIQIIKTTYLRNQKRLENNKKISDKDNRYFELAENYLYHEIATVLHLTYDETKDYIVTRVTEEFTK